MKRNKTILAIILILTLGMAVIPSAQATKFFEITFQDLAGALTCDVSFFGTPPPPATVDKILHSAVESAALLNPSHDIIGMAFVGDDSMSANQYSGAIAYKATTKKIISYDEYSGIKTAGVQTQAYWLQTQEDKTIEGIKPERKWLLLTLVYPKAPPTQEAYNALMAEIEKAAKRGMDVIASISTGDKAVKTSWQQLRDPDGGSVFLEYSIATKRIYRKEMVYKVLQ